MMMRATTSPSLLLVMLGGLVSALASAPLPVIQMHGMGDFAKNPAGMVPLAHDISKALGGVHVHNIQIGNGPVEDMMNSFFMNMNDQVKEFAEVVRADSQLSQGFNAIGYSQGNLIIRAYIERYNSPPVKSFISLHGPMMGVAGLPNCNMTRDICDKVDELVQLGAYTPFVQQHLAQANYLRDPMNLDKYLDQNIFLPDVNNEEANSEERNQAYTSNFGSLSNLVLVKAAKDSMVFPAESEWFGFFKDGSQKEVVAMKDSPWYQSNSFGLKTLDEQGKISFYTTEGDHLKFSEEFLLDLVVKYFSE